MDWGTIIVQVTAIIGGIAAVFAIVNAIYEIREKRQKARLATAQPATGGPAALLDPLSQGGLDILRLIAQGLSNHKIGARLFLAWHAVQGHNRVIFDKL